MDPVVIIGFGIGAIGTIRAITSNSRDTDILVIEKRGFDTYSPCGMPYVVGGEVADHEHLKHAFPPNKRITIRRNTEAVSIDRENNAIKVRSLEDGGEEVISYSHLVIDTGANPLIPPISFNKDLLNNGVYTFTKPSDVDLLLKAIPQLERVAIVGAGAIGLEMAQAIHGNGKDVLLVEMADNPLPSSLDKDMAKLALEAIPEAIEVRFSTPLNAIEGDIKVEAVVVGDDRIPVDAVVLCLGVVPNTFLAKDAGLETSRLGIVVDQHMRTNDPKIHAVGDCIQSRCKVTGDPTACRIAVPALHQGMVAGQNILGNDASYRGSIGAFVTVIGDKQFASVGLKTKDLEGAVSAKVKLKTKPEFMGADEVVLKLVSDGDGRLIGAQAVGPNAAELINRASLGIDMGISISQLARSETAYCPPVSDVFDPVTTAAETLLKKLERKRR